MVDRVGKVERQRRQARKVGILKKVIDKWLVTSRECIEDVQNPNLKRYIASVGWSDTGVYAGGSAEPVACSYEGSASASSTGVGG